MERLQCGEAVEAVEAVGRLWGGWGGCRGCVGGSSVGGSRYGEVPVSAVSTGSTGSTGGSLHLNIISLQASTPDSAQIRYSHSAPRRGMPPAAWLMAGALGRV